MFIRLPVMIAVVLLISSCTMYAGPVRLGSVGSPAKYQEPDRETDTPPETTGDITLAFTGVFGADAGIRSPWGISFGVDGTLYVCDRDRSSVVRLDEHGAVLARFGGSGVRTERLYAPIDVCSSAGMSIYAIDASDSRILRFDRNLKNAYVLFSKDSEKNRLFGTFNGLGYDKDSGDLYVTDRETGSIIRIDMLGKNITSRGSFGSSQESLKEPCGLDVAHDGTIYIADKSAGTVAILDNFGGKIRVVGENILHAPSDVALLDSGAIAVADRDGIVILSSDGRVLGATGFGKERALSPRSLAAKGDQLLVADARSGNLLVYRIEWKQ